MSPSDSPVELLPIRPFTQPVKAQVSVPGSKSITNRALAIGALCQPNEMPRPDGTCFPVNDLTIVSPLWSRDTNIMFSALQTLGLSLERVHADDGDDISIKKLHAPGTLFFPNHKDVHLHVGNAGTAARFLTALLCLQPDGVFHVDGDEAMYRRPMKGLTDALESLGARFEFHKEPGCIPFTLRTAPITVDSVSVNASESSQILSALLIMASGLERPFEVRLLGDTVSKPFVEMTVEMLRQFDVGVVENDEHNRYVITGPARTNTFYTVEPDATAASYFTALPMVTESGSTSVNGLNYCTLQGDKRFLDILEQVGLKLERNYDYPSMNPEEGVPPDYVVSSRPENTPLNGICADFEAFSDTFLTLAALTPLLDGKTRIEGIAHTRKQETDRVAAMATELKKLGQHVVEEEGALEITPDLDSLRFLACAVREAAAEGGQGASGCIEIDTYHDHRFAMSFAILGSYDLLGDGQPWLAIRDPMCCSKTFPNFFEVLQDAWDQSHTQEPSGSL